MASVGRAIALRSQRSNLLVRGLQQPEEVVRGLLRSGGRDEDRAFVLAQDLEPRLEIARVVQLAVDPAMGAQERRAHFRDQLFRRIGVVAEALSQLAVASARLGGPVGELVQRGRVVAPGIGEGARWREVDLVVAGAKNARVPPCRIVAPDMSSRSSARASGSQLCGSTA